MAYKQLGFVDKSARDAMEYVEGAYSRVRGFFPGFVVNPTEKYIGPLVVQAQDICQKVLHNIDGKVDSTVHLSQDLYKSGVDRTRNIVGDEAVDQFSEAKSKYVAVVTDGWQFFRKNGVTGSASSLIKRRDEAGERIKVLVFSTATAFGTLTLSVWDKTRSQPPVQKTVSIAKPYVDWAQGKYMSVHDKLVATPQYASVYNLATGIFFTVLSLKFVAWPVNKTKDTFYPYVQWIADPTLQQVDPYVKTLQNHLKPTPAAAAAAPEPLPASKAQAGNSSQTAPSSGATKVD